MDFEKLDRYLSSFSAEKNVPGCGCSVWYRHQPVFGKCYGYADIEKDIPFSMDSLVCLYSATKLSTVVCGMHLVETGVLSLDAPVSDYLPEFRDLTVREEDGTLRPARMPLLVRHLFTMQGGFTYDRWDGLEAVQTETAGRCPTRDVIRSLAAVPLVFDPGTHFRYSYCHDILGAVIEAAACMRFGDALRKYVFDVIGMDQTSFHISPEVQDNRMAVRYHRFNGKTNTWAWADKGDVNLGTEYESGGGGLISCINDYILLAETLTNRGSAPNGRTVLRPETVDLLRTPQLTGDSADDFTRFGGWSKAGYSYGLGVRTLVNRERNNSLSSNGEFGWDGKLGCYMICDPEQEVAVFYAQHEEGSRWPEWHGMIRNTIYACL